MDFLQPHSWAEALQARTECPEALIVAGGTDVLVGLNFGRIRPAALMDITRVTDLKGCSVNDGWARIGATATYHDVIMSLRRAAPALVQAAHTVGSPQIRNRGTVGGNLGTASPAGDSHPPLLAANAEVELASTSGTRRIPIHDFFIGPKRSVLKADEIISAIHVPVADGPQHFAKVGTRNAMVIAVCSFAIALHPRRRSVGTGIGSAGPVPLRAITAEKFLADVLDEGGLWESRRAVPGSALGRFADLVADAARPIDDVRGTADYRTHALRILACRLAMWTWDDFCKTAAA